MRWRVFLSMLMLLFLGAEARANRGGSSPELSLMGKLHAGRALEAFNGRRVLSNGLVYGESIRKLDLRGMTPAAVDKELLTRGFRKQATWIRNIVNGRPLTVGGQRIPLLVYTHKDGGTVRVKPVGDPTSPYLPQPNAVKTLRWPYNAPGDGFRYEALKVDYDDRAIPRIGKEIRMREGESPKTFLDRWASQAHADLATSETPSALQPNGGDH